MVTKCLLWDFGDTLCDELSLWRVSKEWMAVYHSFDDSEGIGAAWSLGDIDTAQVISKLSERMTLTETEIQAHLSRTELFDFFPFTYEYFRAQHLPQAVVTVNPVIFRDMSRKLEFDQVTDTIVISGEENTIDKGVLCAIALRRMPLNCHNYEALLIDNKQSNLDEWATLGGKGYLYISDSTFKQDVENGRLE